MADEPLIDVSVETNIDLLDAEAIRRHLRQLVDHAATHGYQFLRAVQPRETGAMERHTNRTHVVELADLIRAEVGITRVDEAGARSQAARYSPGSQDPADYPLFRDRGTGIFGPAHSPIYSRGGGPLKFPGAEGHDIFRASVEGMRGAHFMAATYAEMQMDIQMAATELGHAITQPGAL